MEQFVAELLKRVDQAIVEYTIDKCLHTKVLGSIVSRNVVGPIPAMTTMPSPPRTHVLVEESRRVNQHVAAVAAASTSSAVRMVVVPHPKVEEERSAPKDNNACEDNNNNNDKDNNNGETKRGESHT